MDQSESYSDSKKAWANAETYFPDSQLAELLGISLRSLKRYKIDQRKTPDKTAVQLHWLLTTVLDLSHSYNPRGVQYWFSRPRIKLNNKTPAYHLNGGNWHPNDATIQAIRDLARESVFANGIQ